MTRSASTVEFWSNRRCVLGPYHCLWTGVEKRSVFDHNLAILVRPTANMLTSDLEASCFWTSSPSCLWRNNAAVSCDHFGYWFELGDTPSGASFNRPVCPYTNPLGAFVNNTAHSCGLHGLHVYPK